MPDHIHLLVGLRPEKALLDLLREIKANSSKFINKQKWLPGRFSWQEGFGAFSYVAFQVPGVIRYIQQQQQHHTKRGFQEEYQLMLEKFNLAYDPHCLFTKD